MTQFQNKVYKITSKIPKGKVVTYKQIAEATGIPEAARAVGNALNKNFNRKVPCHRVVKSNGGIGGFRGGVKKKTGILTQEGVKVENGRVDFKKYLWNGL